MTFTLTPRHTSFLGLAGALLALVCSPPALAAPAHAPAHAAAAVPAAAPATPTWHYQEEGQALRQLAIQVPIQGPSGSLSGLLRIQCGPGKEGSVGIEVIVAQPEKETRFHFDDFEGPDAPAAKRKLLFVTVHSPRGDKTLPLAPAGSYVPEPHLGFQFGVYALNRGQTPVRMLIDALRSDGQGIEWVLKDSRDKDAALRLSVSTEGQKARFEQLTSGCLR